MSSTESNSKNHRRSYTRFRREQTIKRKRYILKNVMSLNEDYFTPKRVGLLNKGKVHCSCKMCRYEQFHGFERFKYENKQKVMQKEIEEFFKNGE